MRERPILFSAPMVRAILEGRKTVTRRVVKLPKGSQLEEISWPWMRPTVWLPSRQKSVLMDCPYGEPGDQLWVRESWCPIYRQGDPDLGVIEVDYRATPTKRMCDLDGSRRWKPSIHMPRSASRIQLEITAVRVERLHQISRESALDEGCSLPDLPSDLAGLFGECPPDERTAFASLWSRINGDESWDANPWVWVVEFKVIKGAQHG